MSVTIRATLIVHFDSAREEGERNIVSFEHPQVYNLYFGAAVVLAEVEYLPMVSMQEMAEPLRFNNNERNTDRHRESNKFYDSAKAARSTATIVLALGRVDLSNLLDHSNHSIELRASAAATRPPP